MSSIKVIAIDAAFSNMGLAAASIKINGDVICHDLLLVSTEGQDKMVVRKSSNDLRRAQELVQALKEWTTKHGPQIAFAEVPSGSQSAAAARALGIAVGVLASCSVPIIEVSPMEVKRLFGTGKKGATKEEIIDWACRKWPGAPWKVFKGRITKNNEHLADAMATIAAGIKTPAFKQLMSLHNATTSPDHQRPTSNRRTLY